jgi:hypothetical protein
LNHRPEHSGVSGRSALIRGNFPYNPPLFRAARRKGMPWRP